MTDESLLLDVEIVQKEHDKAIAKMEKQHNKAMTEKDKEIIALKAEIEKLKQKN